MTVSFRLKAADHWALNRYVMTHDFRSGGPLLLTVFLVPAFMLASMLREGKTLNEAAMSAAIVIALAILVGYPLFRLMALVKFRSIAARLQQIEMTLENGGVRIATPTSSQLVKWSSITRVRRDRQAIYLFLSNRSALIVPLRAFATLGDASSFVEFARKHTADR